MTAPASPALIDQDGDKLHAGGAQHASIRPLLDAFEFQLISRA
jgi:hypothetical protein